MERSLPVYALAVLHDNGAEVLRYFARCDRCLGSSPMVDGDRDRAARELAELGWELRDDRQTWCLECSIDARTPKGRPNQRGVVKRRRRR